MRIEKVLRTLWLRFSEPGKASSQHGQAAHKLWPRGIQYHLWPRAFCLIALVFSLSCGHFQGPRYTDNRAFYSHENSTPQEIYDSPEVLEPPPRQRVGPFRLQWPVHKVRLSRAYSEGRRPHLGLDLVGNKGDPILAAHDGIVIYCGQAFKGYGKMIILEYDKTWATLYSHLIAFKVKAGDEVSAGQIIGLMGRTGRATGVHLHFELMRDKQPIDPEPLLNQQETVALGSRSPLVSAFEYF
jgi:murein DD-endopeptidase MepM/ murein hydrolase activator NlpD